MRTTITLADDVAAAVERLRGDRSISLSAAVNELARAGISTQEVEPARFRQQTHDLGRGIGFDNIADALETL